MTPAFKNISMTLSISDDAHTLIRPEEVERLYDSLTPLSGDGYDVPHFKDGRVICKITDLNFSISGAYTKQACVRLDADVTLMDSYLLALPVTYAEAVIRRSLLQHLQLTASQVPA